MARGDSLVRQLKLMERLLGRGELDVDGTARDLGASRRTVYRDLQVLSRFGVPIYQEADGRRSRWRVLSTYKSRLRLTLTFGEALALLAARGAFASARDGMLGPSFAAALDKVQATLPPPLVDRLDRARRWLSATTGPERAGQNDATVLMTLAHAIEAQETIRLAYRKPGERRHAERLVDPYHLHVQSGALYLVGFCHKRSGL